MINENFSEEEWFSLDQIELVSEKITSDDPLEQLYCIAVDAPEKQFLIFDGIPTHNTDEGKEEDALKGEAAMIIGSIARLGRAAGVHLVIATQRPDAKIISGETKANLGVRINAGRTDSNASSMILGNGEGMRVRSNPRGRLYLRIFGSGNHGQGFFAPQEWIDNYLKSKGLNPDGSPIGGKQSKLANVVDMSSFDDADLDSQSGIDNSSIIEKIRESEASGNYDDDDDDGDFGYDDEYVSDPTQLPGYDEKLGRPEFAEGKDDSDKFTRPEESWDSDLEDLIAENNDD